METKVLSLSLEQVRHSKIHVTDRLTILIAAPVLINDALAVGAEG